MIIHALIWIAGGMFFLVRSDREAGANIAGVIMICGVLLLVLPAEIPYSELAYNICSAVDAAIILICFWTGLFSGGSKGPPTTGPPGD